MPALKNSMYERLKKTVTGVLLTLLEWERELQSRGLKPMTTGDAYEDKRRRRRVAAWSWSLGAGCVGLIILASVLHSTIVWAAYLIVQLAFFPTLVVAIKLRSMPPSN